MPELTIICPTINGREHWLKRCRMSYLETGPDGAEFLILRNYPTCNEAWNIGVPQARGDYIHITADDIEAHPGWWEAGRRAVDLGFTPCPRILNSDGTLQSCGNDANEAPELSPSKVARIPLVKREWIEYFLPFPEIHYMGDYWLTAQLLKHNIRTLVVRDYLFTHGFAMEGRLNTLDSDISVYRRALAEAAE